MLTIVPHDWILVTVRWQAIDMSIAARENNELQKYKLTWFYISFLPVRERGACGASLTTGMLGGDRKAPDPSGRLRGGTQSRHKAANREHVPCGLCQCVCESLTS
jgi:hypothetical protein